MQRAPIVEQMWRRAMTTLERSRAEVRLVEDLRASMRGEVIDRGHPAYDEARSVWNGLIDRHPAAIARCRDAGDVIAAVLVAREHRPPISVRGGDDLSDAAIATMLERVAQRPTPESVIYIRTLGGAIARVDAEETAYAHRAARFNASVDAIWSAPELDETAITWARSTWYAIAPHATGGVYLNFAGVGEEQNALRAAAYGPHEERLAQVRRRYDPEGHFEAAARQP